MNLTFVGRCWWSPTGWALWNGPNESDGLCTCDPREESGAEISPKRKYHWERRIKRILRKTADIEPDDPEYWGLQ